MGILETIIIGIVQGLTEFLPVSSSGHIELSKAILSDAEMPKEGILLTVVLHMATALSTVVIFRKDIVEIFKGLLQFKWNEDTKFALCVVISMFPAALIGLFFEDDIDRFFSGNILLVGIMLLITGLLLFLADRAKNTTKGVSTKEAIIIGISQGIAILPGISRSGATIGTSVLLGVDRSKAARFSFLMVIPLIMGAMVMKSKKLMDVADLESANLENRVSLIVEKVEEDFTLDASAKTALIEVIQKKENAWEKRKGITDSPVAMENDQKSDYESDLKTLNLGEELTTELTEHEVIGFRSVHKTSMLAMICGFFAAFLTGIFACQWMISLVKKAQLKYFSYYCFIVGAISVAYAAF